MWSSSDTLTALDVKQYVYCPVIPWLIRNYGVREPETYSMSKGKQERESRLQIVSALGLEPPIRFDVSLYSPRLRLAGVVDAVAGTRRLSVVEVKLYPRKTYRHFKAQLMTYALLVEQLIGPTRHAILLLSDRQLKWDVTSDTLREAERLIASLRLTVESEKPPLPRKDKRCGSCWYKRLCPWF